MAAISNFHVVSCNILPDKYGYDAVSNILLFTSDNLAAAVPFVPIKAAFCHMEEAPPTKAINICLHDVGNNLLYSHGRYLQWQTCGEKKFQIHFTHI